MDLLKDAAKNLNLYEVKAYVRKAQNVAMNLTEIESKVREATNNEPWGAPSTLMAQIASATYNYREREEIIAFIFRRFTEKAANEWRQVYKSLQLLDYLIKNGSERLIDDVRSNLSLIQMLKSFHYIDSKGRDQGINVRNKAKNLINLLNDDTQIRNERKKARANQKKFGGVSSAAFGGASSIGTSYGGSSSFNDVDDDEFSNRVYGDGGVYGERYDDPASAYNNGSTGTGGDQFEEYDVQPTTKTAVSKATTGQASRINAKASKSKPQPKEPEGDLLGDLLGFDDTPSSSNKPATTNNDEDDDDDDDFDDFQAAPTQTNSNNLSNNLSSLYHPQQQQQSQPQQPQFQQFSSQQNIFASSNTTTNSSNIGSGSLSTGPAKSSSSNDAFSSLFSSAKSKSSTPKPKTSTTSKPSTTTTTTTKPTVQDDDFFNDFTSSSNQQSKPATNGNSNNNNNGEIDLLSF
ncbi:ENT3 [Candida jiufengensis]|uniref:ENT3 n=1 Tax=Candida jiufengensis TaxID=497108 RepID=UPI0022247F3A|nr:ENT3 [Candida jiufengensis]KAI5951308.1 ENT3 [Candida jiufengensis]